MPEAADILARLDAIMAELAELRAAVVAQMPAVVDAAGRVPVVAAGGRRRTRPGGGAGDRRVRGLCSAILACYFDNDLTT
jgi:hypothetical protein